MKVPEQSEAPQAGKETRQAAPEASHARDAGPTPADRFATLDEYLAFLEKGGAIDKPWYREVSPGVYELVTTFRPVGEDQRPQRFTREELERKFGFDR